MIHPPGWFWPDGTPWQVFQEDRSRGRATYDVIRTGVTRAEAELLSRQLNERQRQRYGRRPWYAAPMEARA